MALRKVGKYYHILYRDLSGAVRTRATGETDKDKARIQERVWMAQLKAERIRRRHGFMLITSDTAKMFPDKEENGDVYEKKSFFTNDEMEK